MSDEKGSVYLAVNESMPGLVKIGMTTGDVQSRMKELSADTGVPTPFTCPYSCEVQNPAILEKQLHENFDYCRENDKREFFRTDWQAVHAALQLWGEKAGVPLPKPNNAPSSKVGKFSVNKWAKEGEFENVRRALAEGGDPNQKDANKITALVWAAEFGYTDIVQILLDKGADPTRLNKDGQSALFEAKNGVIAKMLLEKGADPNVEGHDGDSPLWCAIQKSRADVVKVLLNAGAEFEHNVLFETKDGVIAKIFLDEGADPNRIIRGKNSPLTHAVAGGHTDVVEVLLDAGAVIESDLTKLTSAVRESHGGVVGVLLEHAVMKNRADVLEMLIINSNDSYLLETDVTSLFYAISWDYVEVVRVLLEWYANPDIMNSYGDTPLTYAIKESEVSVEEYEEMIGSNLASAANENNVKYQIVEMLLKYTSPNITDSYGNSPFMYAVQANRADIVERLLEAKVDPNGLDGESNLNTAIRNGNIKIVKILLEYGTDPKPHLDSAIKEGNIETVKMLLENGADPKPHLDNAVKQGNIEIIKMFISRGVDRDEFLAFAAIGNYSSVVKELLATNTNATKACEIALQKDHPDADPWWVRESHAATMGNFYTVKDYPDVVKLALKDNFDLGFGFDAMMNKNRAEKDHIDFNDFGKLIQIGNADRWKHFTVIMNKNRAEKDYPDAVKLMLANNADPWGCFTAIVDKNRADMVSVLLKNGLNPEDALEHAANVGHISVVKALLDNHAYSKLIMTNCMLLAAKKQRLHAVRMLIDSGANPNGGLKGTVTSVAIVKFLIFKGADLDKAIGWAVHSNHIDMVKDLLYQGANPQAGLDAAKNHKVNADIKWMLRRRAFGKMFGL